MKKLVLGLLVLVSFQQVSAKAREFRILSSKTSGDLSLAWGVKGTEIDFESYDAKSEDEQWKFFDDNAAKVENYLVDLKTQKVLAVIRPADANNVDTVQGPIIEFSNLINTNHNSLSMSFDSQNKIVLIEAQARWTGGAESLVAIEENSIGQNQAVGFCNESCADKVIMRSMKAQMTKAQLKDYDSYEVQSTYYELKKDKMGQSIWEVTAASADPKTEGTTYRGYMRLTFAKGQFKAVFGKITKVQ